jgi:hypothetical protein
MGAHALLVGISRFDDPKLAKLNSPHSDVEAFGNVLKDSARGGFDSVEISIDRDLLDIRDQLSTLMDGRSADDMVLLYYSGHGIVAKGGRLYLATGQSSFDRPQARSIATSEIRDLMEQSRAGRLVVILDCCHSGVFAEGAKGAESPAMTDNTFGDGSGSEGQYVLTATDALQYAYDGTGELREAAPGPTLSRFTRWLVDGIGGGEASPLDEEITLDALYQYLCRRAKTEQAGMTPQRFVKRGSGEMVIAKNPSGKSLALADDLIAKLDAPDWRVRKEAIADLAKLAKQPRMVPLVKKALVDRVSIERDVDVREAMLGLLDQLGPRRPDPVDPDPPRPPKPPAPPPPAPPPSGDVTALQVPLLDNWQKQTLVKSGIAPAALRGLDAINLIAEVQRRAEGLRIATYMHRTYIAAIIIFGLGAFGQAQDGLDQARGAAVSLLVLIGFGIAGLLNRKKLPAPASSNPYMKRLQETIPLIESRWGWGFGWNPREYEAKNFYRSCWWMAAGGTLSLLLILSQL